MVAVKFKKADADSAPVAIAGQRGEGTAKKHHEDAKQQRQVPEDFLLIKMQQSIHIPKFLRFLEAV